MEFKIDRDVMQVELKKAAGTVSNKDAMPILKNFLMEVKDGILRITSTDLSLGAITELNMVDPSTKKSNIVKDGKIAAPAKEMSEIASTAHQGYLHFKLEGTTLKIKSGYRDADANGNPLDKPTAKNEWVIHCMEAINFPDLPRFDEVKAKKVPRESFVACLDQVSFATADSELRANLMAVHINNGYMYATDGSRACRKEFKTEVPVENFTVPRNAVNLLVSLLKGASSSDVYLCDTGGHLLFKVGEDLYSSRKLELQFPDVEKVLISQTDKYPFKMTIPRQMLVDAIKRAQITSEENRSLSILCSVDDGATITLRSKNTKDDTYEEVLKDKALTWDGAGFDRGINWEWLLDMLQVLGGEVVHLRMGEDKGTRKTYFRFDEGDFVGIILPLRIRKDEQGKQVKIHKKVADHVAAHDARIALGETDDIAPSVAKGATPEATVDVAFG